METIINNVLSLQWLKKIFVKKIVNSDAVKKRLFEEIIKEKLFYELIFF